MSNTYSSTKYYLNGVPVPKETKTYKPVSHGQLIDLTLESIDKAGFKLDKESYTMARNGMIANGRFSISNVADSEMQLQIAWQNSYDKSRTLKFAIGTRIFICDNGCVSGDYGAFRRKHQGDVQEFAPSAIIDYISAAGDGFTKLQKEREIMKHVEIDSRIAGELVGRLFIEEGIIHSTQLNIINRELKNPTFDYGAPNSLWELYQHTTYAMRNVHPSLWMEDHIRAHDFFVNASGELKSVASTSGDSPDLKRQLSIFDQLEETANDLG